jgi:hypothetical protein
MDGTTTKIWEVHRISGTIENIQQSRINHHNNDRSIQNNKCIQNWYEIGDAITAWLYIGHVKEEIKPKSWYD